MSTSLAKPKVIAEVANTHQGDIEVLYKMIKSLSKTSTDFIKFQIYSANELLVKSHKRYEHFKGQSFSKKEWGEILDYSKKNKLKVIADVFGFTSLEICKENEIRNIKIHSSDLTNKPLLQECSEFSSKIFLSCGGSNLREIKYALDICSKNMELDQIILMHGFQAYPTELADNNLKRLRVLKRYFGNEIKLGFMDHTDAEYKNKNIASYLSVTLGTEFIEKHVTTDRKEKRVDYFSSLNLDEFQSFLDELEEINGMLGKEKINFSASEKKYRNEVRKNWVTNKDIKAKSKITEKDLVMKRTDEEAKPLFIEDIVGRKIKKNLKKDKEVNLKSFKNNILAIVVARSRSSRLPEKAFIKILKKNTLEYLFERILEAKKRGIIDEFAFCTTNNEEDDKLEEFSKRLNVETFRGANQDVLARMMLAVNHYSSADHILRITGDDILLDIDYLKDTIDYHLLNGLDYTSAKDLPSGTEVEIFKKETLRFIYNNAKDSSGTEYLTTYVKDNENFFNCGDLPVDNEIKETSKNIRLTLDTKEDLKVISDVIKYFNKKNIQDFGVNSLIQLYKEKPKIFEHNQRIKQKQLPPQIPTELVFKKEEEQPLVTIYIANHNYGKYLKSSIESVLAQTYKAFELIIVDDGSTDNSNEILKEYSKNEKVEVIRQTNQGLVKTNNIVLNRAKGKYIIRLDADDYFDPMAIEILVNKIDADEDTCLVYPDYYLIDENDQVLGSERRLDINKEVSVYDEPAHGACTLFRTNTLIEMGGYSDFIDRQDGYDMWVKMINSKKISNVNLPLFYYRQHENNLTKNDSKLLLNRSKILSNKGKSLGVEKMNHVCIIPVRSGPDEEIATMELKKGVKNIDLVINELNKSELLSSIVLTSDSEDLLKYISKNYPDIILHKRDKSLAELNTAVDSSIESVLFDISKQVSEIDTVCVAHVNYPLRSYLDINSAINSIYLFEVESSITVIKSNGIYYKTRGNGLEPITKKRKLRLEQDIIYKEAGGIYCSKYNDFIKSKKIVNGGTAKVLIDYYASLNIRETHLIPFIKEEIRKRS